MIDLQKLKRGAKAMAPRIVVYGGEGVGKSTFFAGAPTPVFFQAEDGLANLEVACYPETRADSLSQLYELIEALDGEHDFGSLVIDSADWLEQLIAAEVCATNRVADIEKIPYGKGYVQAAVIMGDILARLDALRAKGMLTCLTAHAQVVRYDDPLGSSYDTHRLKMHKRLASLVAEWADVVGFASLKVHAKDEKRASTTGERVLHVSPSPAHSAKNRFGLTRPLPLEWDALMSAIRGE